MNAPHPEGAPRSPSGWGSSVQRLSMNKADPPPAGPGAWTAPRPESRLDGSARVYVYCLEDVLMSTDTTKEHVRRRKIQDMEEGVAASLTSLRRSLPPGGETFPRRGGRLPRRGERLPPRGERRSRLGERLPRRGEAPSPRGETPPLRGERFPQPGESLPHEGGAAPAKGESLPSTGWRLPLPGGCLPSPGR